MPEITKVFLEHGLLGAAIVALAFMLFRKDRQVNVLYNRLVAKSEKQSKKYHELAREMDATLRELLEKQDDE